MMSNQRGAGIPRAFGSWLIARELPERFCETQALQTAARSMILRSDDCSKSSNRLKNKKNGKDRRVSQTISGGNNGSFDRR